MNSMTPTSKKSRKPPCPVCKTTKYRKIGSVYVCKFGHQLQDYQEEEADEDHVTSSQFAKRGSQRSTIELFAEETEDQVHKARLKREEAEETDVEDGYYTTDTEGYYSATTDGDASQSESEAGGLLGRSYRDRFIPKKLQRLSFRFSLSILYLACAWLRLPVFLNDIRRWALGGHIPYVNIKEFIPDSLRDSKSLILNKLLVVPPLSAMLYFARKLRYFYTLHYGMEWPPINQPLLWIRLMKEMELPAEFYVLLKTVVELKNGYREKPAQYGHIHQALAPLIVALKLVYGLDGFPRIYADDDHGFLSKMPKLEELMKHLAEKRKSYRPFGLWTYKDVISSDVETLSLYTHFGTHHLRTTEHERTTLEWRKLREQAEKVAKAFEEAFGDVDELHQTQEEEEEYGFRDDRGYVRPGGNGVLLQSPARTRAVTDADDPAAAPVPSLPHGAHYVSYDPNPTAAATTAAYHVPFSAILEFLVDVTGVDSQRVVRVLRKWEGELACDAALLRGQQAQRQEAEGVIAAAASAGSASALNP
ncbi:Pol I core factor CF [Quaeritorhiza haematococci]|nr:Pol I core factor CF [Quaeritorhiza haematococci]